MNQMISKNLYKLHRSHTSGDQIFRLAAQLSSSAWALLWWGKQDWTPDFHFLRTANVRFLKDVFFPKMNYGGTLYKSSGKGVEQINV